MLHTLEIFGLPKGYLQGEGHHLNWEQQKTAAAGGRGKKAKKAAGKTNKALDKLKKELEAKK
jgi:ATPase subunit of ABC transporter with duplicated ATPase domains